MTIERYTVEGGAEGRAAWLKRREANINASEVGALFNCHTYLTSFELYCAKTGAARRDGPDDGVLWRGQIFEPAVAQAVTMLRPAWRIVKATHYLSDISARLGATPDYIVECPERGRGVLQLKTVGTLPIQMAHWGVEDARGWEDDALPPLWVQLQTLTEQRLENVSWGAVGALLLDPNNPRIAIREFDRHEAAEQRILAATSKFWDDAAKGVCPAPNYARDGDIIKVLYSRDDGSTIDLSADNRLPMLLERREQIAGQRGPLEKELETINAEIAEKMGEATYARVAGWELSRKLQTRKAIPASEFRVLRVKRTKQKEMAA